MRNDDEEQQRLLTAHRRNVFDNERLVHSRHGENV